MQRRKEVTILQFPDELHDGKTLRQTTAAHAYKVWYYPNQSGYAVSSEDRLCHGVLQRPVSATRTQPP
jgi:hypothetical protein